MGIANDIMRLFPSALFRPPADPVHIADIGAKLRNEFPDELKELYLAFNGFWCLGGTAHLWPLGQADQPPGSVEQLNTIYRQYAAVPEQLKGIIFYGSTTGEMGLGYRLQDRRIVTYTPWVPDDIVEFADCVIDAYERDISEWNRL